MNTPSNSTVAGAASNRSARPVAAAEDASLWGSAGGVLRDPVTGLATRALFLDRVKHALQRRRRTRALFAVLSVVPERMLEIRADIGPEAGAKLLPRLAERLHAAVRDSDTVANVGGEGFTILLDSISALPDASFVADRMQHTMEAPLHLDGHGIHLRVRIGVAIVDESYAHPLDLIRDAQIAASAVNLQARAHYRLYDPALPAITAPSLEAELKHALATDELTVRFAPVLALGESRIAAFEAVPHWNHPERGLLGPGDFVRAAEDAGLSVELDEWLLYRACAAGARWNRSGAQAVDVHLRVSAAQFRRASMLPELRAALAAEGLEPGRLCVAVPESVLMEMGKPALDVLQELAHAGVQICIADFGMGYFTLGHLHRFPVDLLRIDPTFVSGLGIFEENAGIVRTVVALANGLGASAVAPGVQTAAQLEALGDMGCSFAQGDAVSPPLDLAAADSSLRKPVSPHELPVQS